MKMDNQEKLVVIWTSRDRDVALQMAFLYTINSKLRGWWEDVTFVVWGPSAKILSIDEELQLFIPKMQEEGVKVKACRKCADNLGVTEKLENMGIEVIYMGEPLTEYLKEGRKVLTI